MYSLPAKAFNLFQELNNHPAFCSRAESKDHPITEALEALELQQDDPDGEGEFQRMACV